MAVMGFLCGNFNYSSVEIRLPITRSEMFFSCWFTSWEEKVILLFSVNIRIEYKSHSFL